MNFCELVLLFSNAKCLVHMVITIVFLITHIDRIQGRDVRPVREHYTPDYTIYHNYSEIVKEIHILTNKYGTYLQLDQHYTSREHRQQLLLHLTNFSATKLDPKRHKIKLLFSYGEHAREFFPVESLLSWLRHLLQATIGPSANALRSHTILENFDMYIIVMANPDGRVYIEGTQNYCWRGLSSGVDLNRNFNWEFGKPGSSVNREDEEYRGDKPFSEPETIIYRDIVSLHKFDAFISFHSGIRQIYVPYADSVSRQTMRKPDNIDSMLELSSLLSTSTKHEFRYGEAYQLNDYAADGTVLDYMSGVVHIPFSLVIELWGSDSQKDKQCFDLFNPPSDNVQTAADELLPMYEMLFSYLLKWRDQRTHLQGIIAHNDEIEMPTLHLGLILLGIVIIVTVVMAAQNKVPQSCWRFYSRRRVVSLRSLSSTFNIMAIKSP